ncbi:LlaJI family restriction endonuclease [Ligilactobacillus agilis]|uniref:LlaJI family restriction endonuclease n=1 Tax=Ligilactobacillus agilis TaxID=1601 RepID=UPI003D80A1F2
MSRISSYIIREEQHYSFDQLKSILNFESDDQLKMFIDTLVGNRIMYQKDVNRKGELISSLKKDTYKMSYKLSFVGIIYFKEKIIYVYPKYFTVFASEQAENIISHMNLVMKVIKKYINSRAQNIDFFIDNEGSSNSLLSLYLFLLEDYVNNGVYQKVEEIAELNGHGDILWQRTVDIIQPFIKNGRPYYTDVFTTRRDTEKENIIREIHEIILTKCSNELRKLRLDTFFSIPYIEFTNKEFDDIGERDYILKLVEDELSITFDNKHQTLLKAIYQFVKNSNFKIGDKSIELLGTTSFNLVWEKVCSQVFGNQKDKRLVDLNILKKLKSNYVGNIKLFDLIEKPFWTAAGKTASKSLEPDTIVISNNNFIILDAKYYTPQLEKNKPLKGQPGIESITKQYLYQLAYQNFITENNFDSVKNCFLFPTSDSSVKNFGKVKLDMLSNLGLNDIDVRFLPTDKVYDCYLKNEKLDISFLDL